VYYHEIERHMWNNTLPKLFVVKMAKFISVHESDERSKKQALRFMVNIFYHQDFYSQLPE
jgi:hypothetical protein